MTIERKAQLFVLKACAVLQFSREPSLAMLLYTALTDLLLKRKCH